MIVLLADSNALRHPGLKEFLGASRDHAIALSDLTLVEMRKSNALATSRDSLLIASQFLNQTYVLRRTYEMLKEHIASAEQAEILFDYPATIELGDLCRDFRRLPVPERLRTHMAGLETEAQQIMAELHREVEALEPGLLDAAGEFSQAQLTQIRTGEGVEPETKRKLLDLLKETTRDFILRNQEPDRRAPMKLKDATGMFAFRYSLCMVLYYMEWVRVGRSTGMKLQRRVNDVVDMQVAAMGTYFNGVLSADNKLQTTSNTARAILRGFGAYVGADWSPAPGRV